MHIRMLYLLVLLCAPILVLSSEYGIYVWLDGWDPDVEGCDEQKFLAWNKKQYPECYTHTYDTQPKRQWLWDTCREPGREIRDIYMYDIYEHLDSQDCSHPDVLYMKKTILEGKTQVPGLRIHALFADGGDDVPESKRVPRIVWYNENCAAENPSARVDGVAVNNENWDRYWSDDEKRKYMYALANVTKEARKQSPSIGRLESHFSVGWNWGRDDEENKMMLHWNGQTKYVMHHFIDIFDSIDAQVAYIRDSIIEERLEIAGYDYSVQQRDKEMLATVYTDRALPCQITFMPFSEDDEDCATWSHPYKTEDAMFEELDQLQSNVPGVRIVLHHFRGVYSSGGYPGWPKLDGNCAHNVAFSDKCCWYGHKCCLYGLICICRYWF